MDNRVKQVLEYAENQSEKKGINLSSTDKFIIVALAQNGGGFDLNDIQDAMRPKNIENGEINWDAYFDMRQTGWNDRVGEALKNPFDPSNAKTLFQNYVRTGGDDYNTKFMLEKFYEKSLELQQYGYYLPKDLDAKQIEALLRQSKGVEVGQ